MKKELPTIQNNHYEIEMSYLRLKKSRRVESFVIEEVEFEAKGKTMNETLKAIHKLSELKVKFGEDKK